MGLRRQIGGLLKEGNSMEIEENLDRIAYALEQIAELVAVIPYNYFSEYEGPSESLGERARKERWSKAQRSGS